MPTDELPDRFHIAEYWLLEPDQKFALIEECVPEETEIALRQNAADESVYARNRQVWRACKTAGVRPSDVESFFGGDIDHIRRRLKEGKASDQVLTYIMHLADLNSLDWIISPRPYHCSQGLGSTVEAFRHHCETTGNDLIRVSQRSALGMQSNESRVPGLLIDAPHRVLIQSLCREEDILNEWIHLAVPVANDFSQLSNAPALTRFLTMIHETAHAHLDPEDQDAHRLLQSWAPEAAAPAIVLGQIARAWNPFQLYWHVVQDTIQY